MDLNLKLIVSIVESLFLFLLEYKSTPTNQPLSANTISDANVVAQSC